MPGEEEQATYMWKRILETNNSAAQLLVRVALGVVIFPHGAQKAFGWFEGPGFGQTIQTFAKMGFPAWSTAILIVIELIGSVCLVAGFLTRIWALSITASMSICMFMYHVQNGFFMNWFGRQAGEGFEYHILVIGIALSLVVTGSGRLSLDGYLAAWIRRFSHNS